MKNQTDLITSIVAGVLAIIGVVAIFMTKREPAKPAEAPTPKLTTLSIPKDNVVTYANGLSSGSNSGGMAGFPGMGGGRGPMGMGGPMGMSGSMGGPMSGPMGMPSGPGGMGGGKVRPMGDSPSK